MLFRTDFEAFCEIFWQDYVDDSVTLSLDKFSNPIVVEETNKVQIYGLTLFFMTLVISPGNVTREKETSPVTNHIRILFFLIKISEKCC